MSTIKYHTVHRTYDMSRGAEPENTDEELLEAVQLQCKATGYPVVPTGKIAELDTITIKEQGVRKRLKALAAEGKVNYVKSGGYVWWIPEDGEAIGEVDFSVLNWDSINPEEIPEEIINAHPSVDNPSDWERWKRNSNLIIQLSGAVGLVGVGLLVAADAGISFYFSSERFFQLGSLFFVSGFGFIWIGIVGLMAAVINRALEERGIDEWLDSAVSQLKERISGRIPYEIRVERVDLTDSETESDDEE